MKKIIYFLIAVLSVSCTNMNTVDLTVKNETSASKTFVITDSYNNSTIGQYSVNANETKTIPVKAGYYKSTPKHCVWNYENNVWILKDASPIITSIENKLSIKIIVKDKNESSFSQVIEINSNVSVGIFLDDYRDLYITNESGVNVEKYATLIDNKKLVIYF